MRQHQTPTPIAAINTPDLELRQLQQHNSNKTSAGNKAKFLHHNNTPSTQLSFVKDSQDLISQQDYAALHYHPMAC